MYHIFVHDWIQVFGKENVLVLMSETTKAVEQCLDSITQIVKFLQIGRLWLNGLFMECFAVPCGIHSEYLSII
ncbi:hypothetical protein DPMN_001685 [Dreissena polymorpha]|uniref:Uncharacterized protein n=1 Tax=Dreissena polymorpha TaxID=45954 RepID=A0A9D4MHQ3_DREPO|nr:hypothetical protein DPMN_001685 [Dreissena polymorpha]